MCSTCPAPTPCAPAVPTKKLHATLCWAARHLRNFDQGRVERLYARALRGTPSIYDMDFPNACPLPDFDRARQTPPPPPRRTAIQVMLGDGHHARRDAIALLALLAVGLLMPLGLALPRRRWRRFSPRP